MLFCAPPAQAGHWLFSAAGSTATTTITNDGVSQSILPWSPPPDADSAMTLNLPSETLWDSNPNPYLASSCSCNIVASIQIKATWTHEDPNTQNDTNDPPPTSVWVVETSSAGWAGLVQGLSGGGTDAAARPGGGRGSAAAASPAASSSDVINSGSASDGLGDIEVKSPASGPPYVSGSSAPSNPQNLAPPPIGWHKCSVQGDLIVFTGMPRSLSATATATGQIPGEVGVKCGLGPYTIKVHATPYNFARGNFSGQNTSVTIRQWIADIPLCVEFNQWKPY